MRLLIHDIILLTLLGIGLFLLVFLPDLYAAHVPTLTCAGCRHTIRAPDEEGEYLCPICGEPFHITHL